LMTYTLAALEDDLETLIQSAQQLRFKHQRWSDTRANTLMRHAVALIVDHVVATAHDPMIDDDDDVTFTRVGVVGDYRRAFSTVLSSVVRSFETTSSRRQLHDTSDELLVVGFGADARLVARFVESIYAQTTSHVEDRWLTDPRRGELDVRETYDVKRGWIRQNVRRYDRYVRDTVQTRVDADHELRDAFYARQVRLFALASVLLPPRVA